MGQTDRRHERRVPRDELKDKRSPFEHDRDRVLYSPAFQRLAGVTQIASVFESHLLHNRLTHSLKVAQLGRRMAERLERLDHRTAGKAGIVPDVVEVSGLAHDLGHPPFGHATERELNALMKQTGGFEGNAQTFRIVTKLSMRRKPEKKGEAGLDLTRASLNAILKYPMIGAPLGQATTVLWTDRSKGNKWGAYSTERKDFDFARKEGPATETRSSNALIMDWADDISFATHDLEDYIEAGLILPEKFPHDDAALEAFIHKEMKRKTGYGEAAASAAFSWAMNSFSKNLPTYSGTQSEKAQLRSTISGFIHRFACQVGFDDTREPFIAVDEEAQYRVEVLKTICDYYVIQHPALNTVERGQIRLVGDLFQLFAEWLQDDPHSRRIPLVLQEGYVRCKDEPGARSADSLRPVHRAVADYLCTLTEHQTFDMFERMTGISQSSVFGAWFR